MTHTTSKGKHTTTGRKRTVKVKAWAVISKENRTVMWGNRQWLVYDTRKAAREALIDAYGEGNAKVVSCTIIYSTK
jgi:hypothetical protein